MENETTKPTPAIELDNPISSVAKIVHRLAGDLSHADRQEIISAALVRVATGTEHALSAVRWSLADWLREQTETPALVDDVDLKREMQRARRAVRAASDEDLAKWDKLLSRMPEREREVAVRLAAGYSMRDVSAELGIGLASADRARKAIAKRLVDPVLWHPILDALYSLPDSKIGRAEWVTDLSEYRRTKSAERSNAPIATGETAQRKPIFTTWFVPAHPRRINPVMAWYPGQSIRKWEPTHIRSQWAEMPTWAWVVARRAERAVKRAQPAHSTTETAVDHRLTAREWRGLQSGRRWYFTHAKHGTMLSSPVIRREFQPDGMFHPEVQ